MSRFWGLILSACLLFGCSGELSPEPASPRIVSLAPNLTEMLFAIGAGDAVVGRSSACAAPPEAKAVPVVGAFARPNLEALLRVSPTRVVATALAERAMEEALAARGIAVERFADAAPGDVPRMLRRLGALTGCDAEPRAADLEARLKRFEEDRPAAPLRVMPVIWHAPLMTAGKGSYIDGAIALAGGENIGGREDTPYYRVSLEWLLRADPDALLFTGEGVAGNALAAVLAQPGWRDLRAVRAGAVLIPPDPAWIAQPGIHLADGIDWLKAALKEIAP